MSNKIEKIVRHYVTKALAEVIKDLDSLIEQKVQKKVEQRLDLLDVLTEGGKSKPQTLNEVYTQESPAPSVPPPAKRKLSDADLGITDETWKSVYADTLNSDNPILHEVAESGVADYHPSAEKPEHVSERVMEQAGFMRDYSKHVDMFNEIDRKKHGVSSKEDMEAQAKYREA